MAKWNQLTMTVLGDVLEERESQDDQWGEQNHPSFSLRTRGLSRGFAQAAADRWKQNNADHVAAGTLAWDGIALEEVYEALAEDDGPELYAELIQAAAVFANWAECLRRAGHGPADPRYTLDELDQRVDARAEMAVAAPLVNGMRHCLVTPDEGGLATCMRHSGHLGVHYDFARGISWHQAVDPETPGVC